MEFKERDYVQDHLKRVIAQLNLNAIDAYQNDKTKQGAVYEQMTQDTIKLAQKYDLNVTR